MSAWPITIDDVLAARQRLAPLLAPTPLRHYPAVDQLVGHGIQVLVKHENHHPTGSFKVRNGLSVMTSLSQAERQRGVVGASTGNHGQGLAYGARAIGSTAIICVPEGNNPEKNESMRALGATVVEKGADYQGAIAEMERIATSTGRRIAHSTNDPMVIAGAGTMTMEILDQDPAVDAIIVAVGGGSQAVGAMTVTRAVAPHVKVIGVQASGAAAIHDSWHQRTPLERERASTFAEGVATRTTYDLTFPALLDGLADFITVNDAEIAAALRTILSLTHNLVEGAGAMGLAALLALRDRLLAKRVAIVFCGANIDSAVLRRVLNREL